MKNLIWVVLVIAFTVFIALWSGLSPLIFVDLEAVFLELTIPLLVLFFAGLFKDFFFAFSVNPKKEYSLSKIRRSLEAVKLTMWSVGSTGILVSIISIIAVLKDISDLAKVGLNLAVGLIIVFYSAIIILCLLPLFFRLKIIIAEFMSKDN